MSAEGQAASFRPHVGALPAEISFLAGHGVSPSLLAEAARVAAVQDVPADDALLRSGFLTPDLYYRLLAAELGLPFLQDPIAVDPRARYPENVRAGLAPLAGDDRGVAFALAPRAGQIAALLGQRGRIGPGLAVTTPAALLDGVLAACGRSIADRAANALPDADPRRSFRDGLELRQVVAVLAALALMLGSALAWPVAAAAGATIGVGLVFLGLVTLRLAAAQHRAAIRPRAGLRRWPDHSLPPYTLIVPLYRETGVLERLTTALQALDYPAAKLQILLVVEADDRETRDAIGHLRLPASFETVVAPSGRPRTKPRALNVALALARGAFTVVYDAEDVPDPDQLRLAVAAFARCEPDVACLQARLVIDNTGDNWLTRFFTVEYATLFDVINPGLCALDLPVMLGGTSNHFRTPILQAVHGWDAWNVTEDADLGIRLALAGYRVADLPSSTLEEAPASLRAWMRQRCRWMKGFMQVCVAHSRTPAAHWRALGPVRFLAAIALTAGTVVAALSYPVLGTAALVTLALGLRDGRFLHPGTPVEIAGAALGLVLFVSGVLAIYLPATLGVLRRGWWPLLVWVPALPLYYVLISAAAWRGLVEMVTHRFRWNKTEHGLARTSRAGLALRSATARPRPRPEVLPG